MTCSYALPPGSLSGDALQPPSSRGGGRRHRAQNLLQRGARHDGTHRRPGAAKGFTYEWTAIAFQQKAAGNTALVVLGLAVVFVFLVLAAQYESLTLPLAIILVVPMCLFAAMAGGRARSGPEIDRSLLSRLAQRPHRRELRIDGKRILMVHSTPWEPRGSYVLPISFELQRFGEADADIVLYGHTHQQVVRRVYFGGR